MKTLIKAFREAVTAAQKNGWETELWEVNTDGKDLLKYKKRPPHTGDNDTVIRCEAEMFPVKILFVL